MTGVEEASATALVRLVRALTVASVLLAACSSNDTASPLSPGSPGSSQAATIESEAPTTTSVSRLPDAVWAELPADGVARAVRTASGVVMPVAAVDPDGSFEVDTPCSNRATVTGTPITGANVVLDPGHGGHETGAVGPGGTLEKDVNAAVAQDVQQLLEARGATVVLTHGADYDTTIATRAELAVALHPQVFVSIHHNAEPDGPSEVPGNESYYQLASPDSKRLAGLLWEEVTAAFAPYHLPWVADTDHGAKYRPNASGGDYYGILRRAAGVTTVLSEAAFISDPPEERVLADPAFQHVEAQAIADAVVRYVTTAAPGSGFVTPYPRTEPAGGGGGPEGCTDPPLS